jgi:putative transposase
MPPEELRRKKVQHFDEPGHVHELTFSCFHRLPLLHDVQRCKLLSQAINSACTHHHFRLLGFVYMPEHVHLLVYPDNDNRSRIDELLYAIKRPFSFRVKKLLEEGADPLLHQLTVRERPGKFTFRFWQEGPGYDRNFTSPPAIDAAINYIHMNPVRRNLVEDPSQWRWSSWSSYQLAGTSDPDLPVAHRLPD